MSVRIFFVGYRIVGVYVISVDLFYSFDIRIIMKSFVYVCIIVYCSIMSFAHASMMGFHES